MIAAFAPYLLVIAILSIAQWGPIKDFLDGLTKAFDWPGLNVLNAKGEAPTSATYKFNWANAAGTLLLVSRPAHDAVAARQARPRPAHLRRDARRSSSGRRSPSPRCSRWRT